MKTSLLFIVIAFLAGALTMQLWQSQSHSPVSLQLLSTPENDALSLPFSEATRIGNTLYVSGSIGVEPGTLELVPGGIKEETRQAMQNIRIGRHEALSAPADWR